MKHLLLCATLAVFGSVAFAQETTSLSTNTTATGAKPTTAALTVDNDAVRTSASAAMARNFTQEAFDKRWEMEADMYKQAGISEDKIKKLHDINLTLWKSRASGEKVDFQELSRQRSEILDKEEMEKLRNLRREMIQKQVRPNDQATTAAE